MEYGCLSYCGKCMDSPFALVNGEFVSGENAEQLVERIYAFIEENDMF